MRWICLTATMLASCGRERAVTVFAAASLRDALEECARGTDVRFQFEASSTLARQIREGARADVFVTADPAWLDGIATLERFDWLSNRLVCVVPARAPDPDLARVASLALASEQVPAGRYAEAALRHRGIPLPARVVRGSTVRQVLSIVSQGGAEAGIVYATDARIDPGVRVAFAFDPSEHPPIVYAVGVLTPEGRAFAAALRSSRAVLERHGFTVRP
jgi:molybdate transport system substrate-binding protein